jgi:hypothetical protein
MRLLNCKETEVESGQQTKRVTMDIVQNCDSYIKYHRHKPIDSINLLTS